VCVNVCVFLVVSNRTCASQPCAAVAPTPALTHFPSLPSFRGELANKRQPRRVCCSGSGLLGRWMGENIWMPDRCLIRHFLAYFTSLRTNSSYGSDGMKFIGSRQERGGWGLCWGGRGVAAAHGRSHMAIQRGGGVS